jgi:HNH endonuclease
MIRYWLDIYNKQIYPRCRLTSTGCLEFCGCEDSMGYGCISVGKRSLGQRVKAYTHRVAYLAHKGDIGDLQVQHLCNNRLCCNPKHLILGDHRQNAEHANNSGIVFGHAGQSGVLGVTLHKWHGYRYWIARTYINKAIIELYRGKDFFEACCARKSWEAHQ